MSWRQKKKGGEISADTKVEDFLQAQGPWNLLSESARFDVLFANFFVNLSFLLRWIIIYPNYLNSKKTIVEGRKVPVSKGAENPQLMEIADICKHLGFNVKLEVVLFMVTFSRSRT